MRRHARHLIVLAAFAPALACAQLDVSAASAIIIDAGSGKVLWSKDAETSRYPASTTKIMTGMLLVERCTPNETIVAPPEIETVKESSMHLKPGERISAHDMLYAMMLRSANDGAYAVAKHISGSIPAFSKLMNDRAAAIGCTNTHFDNPNGLNDKNHWTCAHDLARIAREAMRLEPFEEVVRTQKYQVHRSINQKDTHMVTRNKWLAKDPTADGIKTGYTVPAGHCYVGSATRDGFRVITVVMKSDHWQLDHQKMLDFAFQNYRKGLEFDPGQSVGTVQVSGGASAGVEVAPASPIYSLVRRNETGEATTQIVPDPVTAPIAKGQKVGELILRDADGFEQSVPLVAQSDVALAPLSAMMKSGSKPTSIFFGGALCVGAYLVRGKARRRMKLYAKRAPRPRA